MWKPKSQQPSTANSVIPLANGENDYSVFNAAHTQTTVRGKGLGLGLGPSAASQNSLKYQGVAEKHSNVSQKIALSDVNHKTVDFPTTASKGISEGERETELLVKTKQSFGAIRNDNGSVGATNEEKAEIGRNARSNWDPSVLSPKLMSVPVESRVEPMIQSYFDVHGEYPEIEYITTNQPGYNSDWYYYQFPEMTPETFGRSFDSMDEVDIDIADICLDPNNISLSPVSVASSYEVQENELHFDSALDISDPEWEENDIPDNEVLIPTDHPFFASYSDDDDA